MTDSPTPGRHRSRRARRRGRSRGLIGPIVSALSVLLATGPVVWLMSSADGSTVGHDDPTEVLNISEDNSGPAAIDDTNEAAGKTLKPGASVTTTLPNGVTTTITPTGTPALGVTESTTSTPTTSGPVTTPVPRTTKTVTVTPNGPRTVAGSTKKPKPSGTPTATRTVTSKPTPSDPPQPPTGGGGTNEQERKVLELSNAARQHEGCGPLKLDDNLVEAAGRHASDMVRRHYMDHTNPDGQGPGDRMAAAGFRGSSWGENIAAGYDTAEEVFAAWMKSDGHRANIMNCKYDRIGIGFDPGQVKSQWGPGSWVQDFGRVGG